MKMTVIVIVNKNRIHERTARTIHSVQYCISCIHDIKINAKKTVRQSSSYCSESSMFYQL